jgi:hypothetical protein
MNGSLDEHSNTSIVSLDGKEVEEFHQDEFSPKRNAKRTAKGKTINYAGSDEENEENQSDYLGSDSETERLVKKSKSKGKEQVRSVDHDQSHRSICRHPRKRTL